MKMETHHIIYRTRAIISRGLYIFYPIFHCDYTVKGFIIQSGYYFVILFSSNLPLPTEENKKVINALFAVQWNLDLRKIVGTTHFLVHQLFDLRKIF
jgi:hypothetical protein